MIIGRTRPIFEWDWPTLAISYVPVSNKIIAWPWLILENASYFGESQLMFTRRAGRPRMLTCSKSLARLISIIFKRLDFASFVCNNACSASTSHLYRLSKFTVMPGECISFINKHIHI